MIHGTAARQFGTSLGSGSFSQSGTVMTVTITNHALAPGDRVFLITTPSTFTGTYRVGSVNGNSFIVTVAATGSSSGIVAAQKVFSIDKLLVEGNTVELATGTNGTVAFHVQDNAPGTLLPDHAHGEVIIRDNKIRYQDGAFDSSYSGYGIHVNGAKNLLVRNNVVECAPADPLRNQRCGSVKYFNNRMPNGILIQGSEAGTGKNYDELETEAEDALVLALLQV